jgi:[ribosomal protein S5]-alanine N-acetyltransferase
MYGPRIEGEHVTLAPPQPGYVEDYLRWFADPAVTRYLEVRHPPSIEQEREFLQRRATEPNVVFWSILLGDRHIGSTGIEGIQWRNRTASTGIVIGERDCWGKGYASEVMWLRTAYAFRELGLETLTTRTYGPNEGSRRALMRAGYREVGWLRRAVYLDGQFHDVWLGQVLREEWEQGQASPRPA